MQWLKVIMGSTGEETKQNIYFNLIAPPSTYDILGKKSFNLALGIVCSFLIKRLYG